MKKCHINISEERHSCDLESIGSIFMPIVKNAISSEDLISTDIMYKWQDIVGHEISCFCYPLRAKYNPKNNIRTLYVEVPIGGYAIEIQHKESYILNKINAYFGYQAIHKINVSQNANLQPVLVSGALNEVKEVELSKEDMNYLLDLTGEIKDEKLRENLIKIGKRIILIHKE